MIEGAPPPWTGKICLLWRALYRELVETHQEMPTWPWTDDGTTVIVMKTPRSESHDKKGRVVWRETVSSEHRSYQTVSSHHREDCRPTPHSSSTTLCYC